MLFRSVLILLIFLNVATLGFGSSFPVSDFKTLEVSSPDILIIAIPEIPGPDDKAYMVIIFRNISIIIIIDIFF